MIWLHIPENEKQLTWSSLIKWLFILWWFIPALWLALNVTAYSWRILTWPIRKTWRALVGTPRPASEIEPFAEDPRS